MGDQTITVNPYDWKNPVFDAHLFAGRKYELSEIMAEIYRIKGKTRTNPIVAITGERRVGKTSLLLRISENCQQKGIKPIMIAIEAPMIQNPWEFWAEVFSALFMVAKSEGLDIEIDKRIRMGFVDETSNSPGKPKLTDLMFVEAYKSYRSGARGEILELPRFYRHKRR